LLETWVQRRTRELLVGQGFQPGEDGPALPPELGQELPELGRIVVGFMRRGVGEVGRTEPLGAFE